MSNCTLLIDAHVHLYPQYVLTRAYRHGAQNMMHAFRKKNHADPDHPVLVWLLTERSDCNILDSIKQNPDCFGEDVLIHSLEDRKVVLVKHDGTPDLYILAGRQIVSSDGLEVLALCTDIQIQDRQRSTADLIDAVNGAGGVPVLNWAPGKWFFSRGKIVQNLIQQTDDLARFLIGDTPLRHTLWPQPGLMRTAVQKGFHLIAGSDPLPFPCEERMIGSYGAAVEGSFDPSKPVASILSLLKDARSDFRIIGWRNDPLTFAWREGRILRAK